MALAVNKAGDAVFWDGQNWSPATVAVNKDTNERVAWDGQGWNPIAAQAPEDPGVFGALKEGAMAGLRGVGKTAQAVAGGKPEEDQEHSIAAEPVKWGDFLHPKTLTEKTLYGLAEGSPTIAAGLAGTAAGAAIPGAGETGIPEIAGGAIGAGAGSIIQTLGPYYAKALKDNPKDPGAAFDTALRQAGQEGAVSGLGWAAFGFAPFKRQVSNLLFQTFGVQPAIAEGARAATNLEEGKPVTEGLGEAYPGAVVSTVVPAAGHAGVKLAIGGHAGAAPTAPEARVAPTPEAAAAPVMAAPTVDAAIKAAQDSLGEPIDIEAMGRAAQMQAEAQTAPYNADRGVNDLLGDLNMQEGQIQREAGAQPAQQPAAPEAAAAQPQPETPAAPPAPAPEETPLPLAAAPEASADVTPSLADTTTLEGRVRGVQRPITNGPVDAATFLALKGGIRNDEGHDLTAGRGLQQFVPGAGPLIRPNGMSIDYAGEALHEAGYFGPPESTPRPTENEVLQFLEQTRRDDQGKPNRLYTPEDQARLTEAAQGKAATEDNARALQDVHDEAHALGETLEPHEADAIVAQMGERGIDPQSAVVEHLERKAIQEVEHDHGQTGDNAYAESIPHAGTAGEIDLGAGDRGAGQEAPAEGPGAEGEAGHAAPANPEDVRALDEEGEPRFARRTPVQRDEATGFDFERGTAVDGQGRPVDQFINEAGGHSAKQLAAAREASGHGKIAPKATQKEPGGLFGEAPDEAKPEQGALFARREGEPAGASHGEITGTFSPEFDAKRGEIAADLRKRLDDLGLHDIALKVPDQINTPGGLVDGVHLSKIIAVALDAKDHGGVLDHESVHAIRALGLFNKSEWSILAGKAAREWRGRYKIDERYGDFDEDKRNEEAVAEAFRYWVKGKGNQTGIVARIFDKVRNALGAIGNAVRGAGFQTAEGIFGRIDRGEVGGRARGAGGSDAAFARQDGGPEAANDESGVPSIQNQRYFAEVKRLQANLDAAKRNYNAIRTARRAGAATIEQRIAARHAIMDAEVELNLYQHKAGSPLHNFAGLAGEKAMFSRRNPQTEDEIYRDSVSDLISTAQSGDGGENTGARLLTKVAQAGIKQIKNVNPLEGGSYIGSLFPRTLASLDDMSARLWRPWMAREEEGHATTERLRRVISNSLVTLSQESRDRVYAALELARKWEWRPPDDGRPIRVRNTSYWQAQKSKIGDNFVLNAGETRAFHDALKLGDEGWQTFMGAIARREGWKGPVDPEAIRAAANEKGDGLPEGKRLLRLADTIEAAQGAMNRPYFPAMRFGDYFIAVKPKSGEDEGSLGGYPKVEWFETVEKPALHDLLGKSRVPAADMPDVKAALERIKAVKKGDGSLAFTDDTHDFEIGDLRSRPNILRQLNIPAVEKLFMLMERGVKDSLRDKIMATNTPEEGATGKDAAQIKREAGEAASEHYEATLGETKDILMDAVYHDLLAGWKKHASMVPGYSADFDRSIGTHLYQVGRNAADIIYRNDIEDAYQNIQDNHPHFSTKQYWAHWRQYQETPQDPLARAAGKTAQLGAVYAMGLNPSTTIMIGSHTPIMATPVLGVGGGMGQATAQMLRAAREVYKELSFDKKKGGFIDTTKLGRNDREKALLAELGEAGLTHSLGADDVRALNDRQAGLWGSAQPTIKKAMDIAMSNVSAVDQANRNAIALAAHRMAMNPATLEKMAAPWMKHNAIFRQMVMSEGLTPENFAKFMLNEGAGAWGRTNQAVAMRGAEGSLLFALHGFQTRFLSTAWKLMFNMGPSGKAAAGWMAAALWAGTGIYGLPFTQDLENAASLLWKQFTGSDPMIDAHLRQFLQDAGLGKIGTEVLLRGPLSVMTGVDLGSRLGFGDIITKTASASDLLGTIPSMLGERLVAAYHREITGQGLGSAAAELLPSALRSPVRAMIESKEGEVSSYGNMGRTPDKISGKDTVLRSLGLPSLGATEARDRSEYIRDLGERDKAIHEQTRNAWANMIMRANRAQGEGDYALAHELSNEASDLLTNYNANHWQTPLDEKSLSDAMMEHTVPEIYRVTRTPGRLRGEAYRNPY